MPLDATPGSPTANSYLTIADADAIADEQGLGRAATAWLAADDPDKSKALIRATSEIDMHVGVVGIRYDFDQVLAFPRALDVDDLEAAYIIPNVRMACYHQALHVLANSKEIDDADTRRARGLVSFSDDDASGTNSLRPEYGLMSARALAYLTAIRTVGVSTLRSVPIGSSYSRDPLL